MRTVPREVGCRLQALTVMAGNRCKGSPNLSSDSGCTWNWILARSRWEWERGKMPRWGGAPVRGPGEKAEVGRRHGQGPGSAKNVIEPHQAAPHVGVIGFVERAHARDLVDR